MIDVMQIASHLRKTMKTKYTRIIIDFSIITLLGIVIFRNFIFTSDWPGGGDVLGWISKAYLWKDFRWLYVWRQYSFGFVEGMGIRVLDLTLMSIYYMCGDAAITIKISMFLSFLMAGFSIYAFAYRFSHQHIASLSASMIYTLNSWFFSQLTEAHVDIVFSYALAPLIFLLTARVFERRRPEDVLVLALGLWVFLTSFHLESTVIYGAFLMLFVFFYVLSARAEGDSFRLRGKHFLRLFLPACVIAFSLSAFHFIQFTPILMTPYVSPSYGYPTEYATFTSYENMAEAFMLKANEQWGYVSKVDLATGLSLPDFPISPFLLGLFSLAYSTIFLRRDRYTFFFAASTLISTFISKGPNPPFGYVFTWAWFNIPYFSVFRAASRSVMMAAFSHSFFVSILVSTLVGYMQQIKRSQIGERFLNVKVKNHMGNIKEFVISSNILNKIARGLHKFLCYFSLALIVCIFLSGFLTNWFFFNQGLQVYTPPKEYLQPYEWIATRPGDYKIVTLGQFPDFADAPMMTDLGFGHDIGYDSSFLHNKPTLQDGGHEPISRAFVDHLRFYLVPERITDDLMEILGTFNYRFVVIPPYANVKTRDFFLNQQGLHIAYNESNSLILENDFYEPPLFGTSGYAFVVGGFEVFSSLNSIDSFKLNETALFFAHQNDRPSIIGHPLFQDSDTVIFVDSDIDDLAILSLRNYVPWINVAEYGARSLNYTKYWIQSPYWRNIGKLVLSDYTLQTSGKNTITIPFSVDSSETYDVWIRLGFGPSRGSLSVSIDKNFIGQIRPHASFWSKLEWIKIGSVKLAHGDHTIRLTNDGTGFNDIDAIAIGKPSVFKSQVDNMIRALQSFPERIVYVLQAESAFNWDSGSGWLSHSSPYNGYLLATEGIPNVSPLGKASASSVWDFEAKYAIDGDVYTRWASSSSMPQWLQIEWQNLQELTGVQIVFENAYAEDYVIQTWNDTNWVDQVSVTGNKELEQFHEFLSPIQTTKLRIYVTNAPAFDMVSIWELESYATGGVSASTSISIPRVGYYMLAARLASGPDYGTLGVSIYNFTTAVSCSSSNLTLNWRELGPVFLNAGEHKIYINATGKIDLDELIVYSLKEGEESLSLDKLFKPEDIPKISFGQITQINPGKYTVPVRVENVDQPFFLVLSESYNPMWRAYVDGEEIPPIPAYSIVNGFLINKTGEFQATVYFSGQTYAETALSISFITAIATVVYFAVKSNFLKRLLRKLRARKIICITGFQRE